MSWPWRRSNRRSFDSTALDAVPLRMTGQVLEGPLSWRVISFEARRMIDPHSLFLLATTLIAVIVLILLIAVAKLNPFLTLFLISLALAMVVGMPLAAGIRSFETGMGNTLGHIAIVVALGTML